MLAGLCSTGNTGEYHCVVYVCTTLVQGYKFHAHNAMNTAIWRYHCGPWNALDSAAYVALTKIGPLPQGKTWENVSDILKDIPMAVPDADRPVFGNRFTLSCLVSCCGPQAPRRTLHRGDRYRPTRAESPEARDGDRV
ncbi:hypothetical protein C8Q79DRAFT_8236 [Trametes meyenii]|nr:hypothetical protein C8Q79DRAFT_8236 [Trametes meyenii]